MGMLDAVDLYVEHMCDGGLKEMNDGIMEYLK